MDKQDAILFLQGVALGVLAMVAAYNIKVMLYQQPEPAIVVINSAMLRD